jgi:hypothetical protein
MKDNEAGWAAKMNLYFFIYEYINTEEWFVGIF